MKHVAPFLIVLKLVGVCQSEASITTIDQAAKEQDGQCNSDEDCKDGLICDTHGWFEKDTCIAGPKTKNYEITEWKEWSDCSATACGEKGVRKRTRSCIPPEFGGSDCPPSSSDMRYFQIEGCTPRCSNDACSPGTWNGFSWDCCTPDKPCFEGEGDCDTDDDCFGDLYCGKNNCPHGFPARLSKNAPDCCQAPDSLSRHLLNYNSCSEGLCKQGEGDCDSDQDCMGGLICDFDHWSAKDLCIAGPNTRDGVFTEWSEWSDCSAEACDTQGTQSRSRSCIEPMFGGKECQPDRPVLNQLRKCDAPTPCPTTLPPPKKSKAACNPATWTKFRWNCCTRDEPCYEGEGDCDFDSECAEGLVCAKNSCPPGFTARFGRSRPDCCAKPL